MATFMNSSSEILRICFWKNVLPGLNITDTTILYPGSIKDFPDSDEYTVLYEDYTEMGKYLPKGSFGGSKWWTYDMRFKVNFDEGGALVISKV